MAALRGSGQLLNNLRKMHRHSHFSTNSRVYRIAGDVKAADKASKKYMTGGGVLSRLAEKTLGPRNSRDTEKVLRDMRVTLEEQKKLELRIQTLEDMKDQLRSEIWCEDSLLAENCDWRLLDEEKQAVIKEYRKSGQKFVDLCHELKLVESSKEFQAQWCNRLTFFGLFVLIAATGALAAHGMFICAWCVCVFVFVIV